MSMQNGVNPSSNNESCTDSDVGSQMVKEVITCLFIIPSTYRVIRQSHQTWWITGEQAKPISIGQLKRAGNSDGNLCFSNVTHQPEIFISMILTQCRRTHWSSFTDVLASSSGHKTYRMLLNLATVATCRATWKLQLKDSWLRRKTSMSKWFCPIKVLTDKTFYLVQHLDNLYCLLSSLYFCSIDYVNWDK